MPVSCQELYLSSINLVILKVFIMLHSLPGPSIYFYRYFANGGGCIKLYSIYRAMNWSTAHQTCEDIGGRLPEMYELKDDSVLYNTNVS